MFLFDWGFFGFVMYRGLVKFIFVYVNGGVFVMCILGKFGLDWGLNGIFLNFW